jgi:hypothetical protein
MSAVLIVPFFVMPFFTVDLDEEIKTRRPQSRMRSGRSVKGAQEVPKFSETSIFEGLR